MDRKLTYMFLQAQGMLLIITNLEGSIPLTVNLEKEHMKQGTTLPVLHLNILAFWGCELNKLQKKLSLYFN